MTEEEFNSRCLEIETRDEDGLTQGDKFSMGMRSWFGDGRKCLCKGDFKKVCKECTDPYAGFLMGPFAAKSKAAAFNKGVEGILTRAGMIPVGKGTKDV